MADEKIVAENVKSKPSFLERGQLVAVLGAAGTFFLYISARSYHDGYLNELGLSSSMFPLSASDVTMYAVIAMFRLLNVALDFVFGLSLKKLSYLLVVFAFLVFLLGSLGELANYIDRKKPKAPRILVRALDILLRPRVAHWTRPAFGIFIVAYGGFTAILIGMLFIVFCVYPFVSLGQMTAREELVKEFKGSPKTRLKSPEGEDRLYTLIQCSDKFCAFYNNKEVITYAISDVKWAISEIKTKAE